MDTAALIALILSALLTLAGALGGYIIKAQSEAIKRLEDRCGEIERTATDAAQRAAETYLRREDCHRQSDAVLDRLKGIEDKLDRVIERIGGRT